MDDEKLKEYILACKQEAESASRERRKAQKELTMLFQNKQDYSNKEDWQSRVFIPKLFMTVMQASSTVKRAIMSTRRLFKLEPRKKDDDEAKKAVSENEELLKNALVDSNFVDTYSEMITDAFLLGIGVIKPLWNGKLTYSNVDIFNLYVDPTYELFQSNPPKYIIERSTMDLAMLKLLTKETNKKAGRALYKTRRVNEIDEDFEDSEKLAEEQARRGVS